MARIRFGRIGMRWTSLASALFTSSALGAPLSDPTPAELEALRPATGAVLVIEYYDSQRGRTAARIFSGPKRGEPYGGLHFTLGDGPRIELWGLTPCPHERNLVDGAFSGSCRRFVEFGMAAILRSGPVVLCRAFDDQQDKPTQKASCFILADYPSLRAAIKIDEFLVSGGYALLARSPDGKALRPDLEDDERIARGFGRGLWTFEHERVRQAPRP